MLRFGRANVKEIRFLEKIGFLNFYDFDTIFHTKRFWSKDLSGFRNLTGLIVTRHLPFIWSPKVCATAASLKKVK